MSRLELARHVVVIDKVSKQRSCEQVPRPFQTQITIPDYDFLGDTHHTYWKKVCVNKTQDKVATFTVMILNRGLQIMMTLLVNKATSWRN
ncbi:hypothetical protein EON65_36100 [archaeon]|nr:MAG: hypothetical protein EON65_36100 [archaeon]